MEQLEEFDKIKAEKEELDVLTGVGVKFRVPKSKLFAFFSKEKFRTFYIHRPPVGVMDLLSREYIKIEINEEYISKDPIQASQKIVAANAMTIAKIVAIAVLGKKSFVPFLSYITGARNLILIYFLTNYFAQKIDSDYLKKLTVIIINQTNLKDFIDSSRLLSISRTTMPNPEEKV